MDIGNALFEAILRMQDPNLIAESAAKNMDRMIIESKIRRSLEKATNYLEVQTALASFISAWANAANFEFNR